MWPLRTLSFNIHALMLFGFSTMFHIFWSSYRTTSLIMGNVLLIAACWHYSVKRIVEVDELKLAPKLSNLHLEMSGNMRQKLNLAAQLFSYHTAALLKLKYTDNLEWSEFFDLVDKFFNVFNSQFVTDRRKPWHVVHVEFS